jgi:hypothetical protein
MAIELELPTDIRKHEQKTIGPLTTKQFCYCVPAAILGVITWTLTKNINSDVQLAATLTVVLPLLLLGFGKVYGLPLDKFIFSVGATVVAGVIDPKSKHRVYKTENLFLLATNEACKKEDAELSGKKGKNKAPKKSVVSKTYPQYK